MTKSQLRQRQVPAVTQMICDRWAGVRNYEEVTASPSFEQFAVALRRMDGRVHTLVVLQACGGAQFTVGGGAGRYVTYVAADEETFWNLLLPGDRKEGADMGSLVLVNAGGQEGEYPARQIVDIDAAMQAGATFLQSGRIDEALLWERQ